MNDNPFHAGESPTPAGRTGGPFRLGYRFGPYELNSYLGRGGFKYVYRATNHAANGLPGQVAIGIPLDSDAESLALMESEFEVIMKLDHPNIVRVFALEQSGDYTILVMEYLPNSLRAMMKSAANLTEDQAVRIALGVANALAYAHSTRVFHRDVKPDNVVFDEKGIPKLLDFGVARILASTTRLASTMAGTPEYMSPEMYLGACGIGGDLWSLGVTLYEMLTGQRPFGNSAPSDAGQEEHAINEALQEKIRQSNYSEQPLFDLGISPTVVRILRKTLHKNPAERYKRAGEMARDLEGVVRKTRMLDDDEGRLEVLIRASVPLIAVITSEEDRFMTAIRGIAGRLGEESRQVRPLYTWSASCGLLDEAGNSVRKDSIGDPTTALDHVIESPDSGIYIFLDMHRHYSPVTSRLVRDAARVVRTSQKSLLFVSPFFKAPEELEKEIALHVFQLPDRGVLEQLVEQMTEEARKQGLPAEMEFMDRESLIRATQGLTYHEAEHALRMAMVISGGLEASAQRHVIEAKTQIIRKTNLLEYYHNSESFASVGGLGELMSWFSLCQMAFHGGVLSGLVPAPKGVLLFGIPGCGKSLSARALAGSWQVPLLRLDVGRVFGAYVGQSEANLRQALQIAEAVSPCVLWLDEIEKGFAGSQNQRGGGVAARVFGTFLTWMQEKQSPVFVVATANDLASLPAELLRRFDERFFVGLPAASERKDIFQIHLRKVRPERDDFDLERLAECTEGYSGAEIEQVVESGLFRAFSENRDLSEADLVTVTGEIVPLSYTLGNRIQAMTQWAKEHTRMAS